MRIGDTVTYVDEERGPMMAQIAGPIPLDDSDVLDLNLYEQHGDGDENRLVRGVSGVARDDKGSAGTWHETAADDDHNVRALQSHVAVLEAKIATRARVLEAKIATRAKE